MSRILCHCEPFRGRGNPTNNGGIVEPVPRQRGISPRNDRKKKVFVALSGGVDSSVSLYLLKKAGYDVIAVFIKIGEEIERAKGDDVNIDKCWIGERRDAMRVAAYLDVPFLTFDFDKAYKHQVMDYFYREYKAGRTPNPDVMCNRKIKFPLFWKKAKALGADFMATGHYARIAPSCHPERVCESKDLTLLAGVDKEKDQSYFLYNLTSKDLEHILYPIGDLTKPEVRKIAKDAELPTAEKKESQGLCFVGQVNIRNFLKTKIKPKKGKVVDVKGKIVGEHEGLYYFTIGQRHGVGVSGASEPYFVVGKNMKKNELIVAPQKDENKFYKKWLAVHDLSWASGPPKLPLSCSARIRYRAPLEKCIITPPTPSYLKRGGGNNGPRAKSRPPARLKSKGLDVDDIYVNQCQLNLIRLGEGYLVKFSTPQRAVAPGQSIVFYRGNEVLGGGIIQ